MKSRLVVGLLAVAFVGWIIYLAWLTRLPKPEILSRAQVMVAEVVIRAKLTANEDGKPMAQIVVEQTFPIVPAEVPANGDSVSIANLSQSQGFQGPGEYALTLTREDGNYRIANAPEAIKSNGPRIYPWTPSIERQVHTLIPAR